MVWDKLAFETNFRFQDVEGNPLGETVRGQTLLLPFTQFTLFDINHQPVLSLDPRRELGLHFDFLIHEPSGGVLAVLEQKSSFLSQRFGITAGGVESWVLTTDATGLRFDIRSTRDGAIVASGQRKMAVATARSEIEIPAGGDVDHRIVLGAAILASHLSSRR